MFGFKWIYRAKAENEGNETRPTCAGGSPPTTLWRPQCRIWLSTNYTTTNHFQNLPIYLDTVLLEDLSRSFRDALK